MMKRSLLLLTLPALLAACSSRRVNEEPVLRNGDRVQAVDAEAAGAARAREAQEAQSAMRDARAAQALAECGSACTELAHGEVTIGMTEAQVLAATGSAEGAWTVRRGGASATMVPRDVSFAPRDAVGPLALVQLTNGHVTAYGYRESTGLRVVESRADATTAGRASALAEQLIREGDQLAAAGDLDRALDRYDRADVLSPANPELDYRIAALLDKQLRPVEALIRYQLFLHRLKLEEIEARGEAAARLAEAIALAQQRIIVLERQSR